jgi:hypothetical protein
MNRRPQVNLFESVTNVVVAVRKAPVSTCSYLDEKASLTSDGKFQYDVHGYHEGIDQSSDLLVKQYLWWTFCLRTIREVNTELILLHWFQLHNDGVILGRVCIPRASISLT